MIQITDKRQCCGCFACASVCPRHCISMEPDTEGFLYPNVDESMCVNCRLCERICPVINPTTTQKSKALIYEIQLQDSIALKESAAGGFFTAISSYVIKNGGIVCGAAFDDRFNVEHRIAATEDECAAFRGSKYVQSNLKKCFVTFKKLLDAGKLCVFSGTPCQVSGLKKFLRKEYDNLITVDLVCAGVPSPKLWRSYLDYQENLHKSRVSYANFRYKTYGYQCSTLKLVFENGKVYSHSGRVDPMMKFFVNGIAKRPICYECPFKGIDRISDFTIFDGWSAEQLVGQSDDYGYTAVLIHTEKAEQIMAHIEIEGSIASYKAVLEDVIKMDGLMVNGQPKKHQCRDEFYLTLSNGGLPLCIEKYGKNGITEWALEAVKPLLYKTGIISKAKAVRKKLKK